MFGGPVAVPAPVPPGIAPPGIGGVDVPPPPVEKKEEKKEEKKP